MKRFVSGRSSVQIRLGAPALFKDLQDDRRIISGILHRLREGCKAMPDPTPMSMFDHVFAEETDELRAEREGFAAYLESFEGAY